MGEAAIAEAEAVLDRFSEMMFKLMMEHHQKHVLELDLTVPQAQALKVLRHGPLCTGELAVELRISAPAVTQLTNRLTRKHLIEPIGELPDFVLTVLFGPDGIIPVVGHGPGGFGQSEEGL